MNYGLTGINLYNKYYNIVTFKNEINVQVCNCVINTLANFIRCKQLILKKKNLF